MTNSPDMRPDSKLLELGEELEAAWDRQRRLEAEDADDKAFEAALEASGQIAEAIALEKATTSEGLFVKARAIQWCYGNDDPIELAGIQNTTDRRIASSIVNDILASGLGSPRKSAA